MNAHRPSCQRSNFKARSGWPSGPRRGFVTVCLLVLSLVLVVPAQFALAQNAPPPPSAEGLTQDLVAVQARLQRARPAEQVPQLLSTLTRLAVARQQLLAQMVEENPEEVLRGGDPSLSPRQHATSRADLC